MNRIGVTIDEIQDYGIMIVSVISTIAAYVKFIVSTRQKDKEYKLEELRLCHTEKEQKNTARKISLEEKRLHLQEKQLNLDIRKFEEQDTK